MKRHVAIRLQQEGIEEQLAELAVADPRLAGRPPLKRRDIHEYRRRTDPLDVDTRTRP